MTHSHPIADEIGEGYAGYWIREGDARLTGPLATFLEFCRVDGYRPVLVTQQGASLSPALARACDAYGVYCAFQAPDGVVYNARTGRSIAALPELWETPQHSERVWRSTLYDPKHARASAAFTIDVCARSAQDSESEPLALAAATLEAFAVDPVAVGPAEPCRALWDLETLRNEFRNSEVQGVAQGLIVSHTGPGSLTVDVRASAEGWYERVQGTFDMRCGYGSVTFALVRQAEQVLRQLAESFTLTSGVISLIETSTFAHRRPGAVADPLPLTAYAGAALIEAQDDALEPFVRRFHSAPVSPTGAPGYLFSQSVDTDEFAVFAQHLQQADSALKWTTWGGEAGHAV